MPNEQAAKIPPHSWPSVVRDFCDTAWQASCVVRYPADRRCHIATAVGESPQQALRNLKIVLLKGWDDVGVEESIQAAWDSSEVPA